jgi:copper resistance protein C
MKLVVRTCVGFVLGLALGANAFAHAKLMKADPPANGTAHPPAQTLALAFSEEISAKLSSVTVKSANATPIPAATMLDKAGKGFMVMLKQPLRPGVYTVEWRAVASDDGHTTSGTYSFTVN